MKRRLVFIFNFLIATSALFSQKPANLTPEMLSMRREKMTFLDNQLLLFNSRGYASPCQYSATGITHPRFFPIEVPSYNFYLNFLEKQTNIEIRDDVHLIYKTGETDPLGCNFRPNAPMVMVTQDEIWQPNLYTRTATFHKEINKEWVTFSLKTWTSVSGEKDEIFLKIRIQNRNTKELTLTLAPHQNADALRLRDPREPRKTSSTKVTNPDVFTIQSEQLRFRVSSSIENRNEKGFEITIPAGGVGYILFCNTNGRCRENAGRFGFIPTRYSK